jgi:recombination protein RecA
MAKENVRMTAAHAAIDQIKQRFGEGSIMRLGDQKATSVDAIPTGCLSLGLSLVMSFL